MAKWIVKSAGDLDDLLEELNRSQSALECRLVQCIERKAGDDTYWEAILERSGD
jgi:hypothetical protein